MNLALIMCCRVCALADLLSYVFSHLPGSQLCAFMRLLTYVCSHLCSLLFAL